MVLCNVFRMPPVCSFSNLCRHAGNGAVLARCAQPRVGLFYQRSEDDEQLVANIAKTALLDQMRITGRIRLAENVPITDLSSVARSSEEIADELDKASLLLVDMRTYTAAVSNQIRGGGTESKGVSVVIIFFPPLLVRVFAHFVFMIRVSNDGTSQ